MVKQYTPGSLKTSQSQLTETSDLKKVWAETTTNFGVGKLD